MNQLSVRLAELSDYEKISDYFLNADEQFYLGMGVDSKKLPKREVWLKMLHENHDQPFDKKTFFYVIWLLDAEAIGHTNINKIIFGEEAYMHLHMWKKDVRHSGLGLQLMKMSIPYYFNEFKLKTLYCEPYALNEAPNKTLNKLGFDFVKRYDTIPGWISFHQPVNRWKLDEDKFRKLFDQR